MRTVTQTTTRYFPDDPKNKVFAVDAYVTVARRIMIEAHDKNAAEDAVRLVDLPDREDRVGDEEGRDRDGKDEAEGNGDRHQDQHDRRGLSARRLRKRQQAVRYGEGLLLH